MQIIEEKVEVQKVFPQFRGKDLKDHPQFREADGYFGYKQFQDGSYMAHCSNRNSTNIMVHYFRFMTVSGSKIFDYRWHVNDQDPLEILAKELDDESTTLDKFCANHEEEWRRYYNVAKKKLPPGRKMAEGKIHFLDISKN
ncbi:MAG: hypothetical protein WCP93_04270 [Candidatus Berkelbacteria bacterium]